MSASWEMRDRLAIVVACVCVALGIRAIETHWIVSGMRSEMDKRAGDRWTKTDMSAWASRLRKENKGMEVPDVRRVTK